MPRSTTARLVDGVRFRRTTALHPGDVQIRDDGTVTEVDMRDPERLADDLVVL